MIDITLNVDGMSCEHCVNAITKSLLSLDGIKDVKVNLKDKTVFVKYDNTKISLDTIKNDIEEQRYDII
jgi:copper chaperone